MRDTLDFRMGTSPQPAVLLLDSVLRGELEKTVLLPMTLAYLVSAYIEVAFPVPPQVLGEVDSLYDSLLSRLPISRHGVTYRKMAGPECLPELLQGASLLLTDHPGPIRLGANPAIPSVEFQQNNWGTQVLVRNASRLYPEVLRQQLTGWVELVNVSFECRQ
jgi:hypothetical protein